MIEAKKPVARRVTAAVPHGVNQKIAVTIYPNGVIGLREYKRRREYQLGVGVLYVQAVASEALAERIARRKARRARKLGRA